MVAERWLVNGTDLGTKASNTGSVGDMFAAPGRRGDNIDVPQRHGQLRASHKLFDSAEYAVTLWVLGVDPATGYVPAGSDTDAEYLARLDELIGLFTADEVAIDHVRPDGSVRRAVCEVIQPVKPSREPTSTTFGEVPLILVNAGAFWVETVSSSQTFTGVTTGDELTVTAFDGITAPMDELLLTFEACHNPELSQPLTGAYVAYDDIIEPDHRLVIDTANWSLSPGDGIPWTPDFRKLRHGGIKGPWFQLKREAGGPVVRFTHEGGGTADFTVSGPRKFLTP